MSESDDKNNLVGLSADDDANMVFIDLESNTLVITSPAECDGVDVQPVDLDASVNEVEVSKAVAFDETPRPVRDEPKVASKKDSKAHSRRKKSNKAWMLWTLAAVVVAGCAIVAVYFLLGRVGDEAPAPVDPEQTITSDVPDATADIVTRVETFDEVSEYTYGQAIHSAMN